MKKLFLSIIVVSFLCLFTGCMAPPASFMRTHDDPGIWKSIDVREGLLKDDLWRTVVDTLSQKYDLEVITKDSGYVRTSWKYTYIIPDRNIVSDRYRSRIIVKFSGEAWNVLQVKCESNWLEPKAGWVLGYDTRLLEDVYGDLQGRVGRIRR